MTLTLVGDVFLGTFLTLVADRVGRRKVLLGGSILMILSGAAFALFENYWVLLLAAIFGVISVTGTLMDSAYCTRALWLTDTRS